MLRGEASADGERGGDGACGSGLSQLGGVLGRQSYSGVAAATVGGGRIGDTRGHLARAVGETASTILGPVPRDARRHL